MTAKEIGRLAFRQEGDNWNAYYALSDTMKDALYLGTIRIGAIEGRPERKTAFMDLMRDVVADILEENTGERPTWSGERTAPEHERTKE
jgi:hypothetical protein